SRPDPRDQHVSCLPGGPASETNLHRIPTAGTSGPQSGSRGSAACDRGDALGRAARSGGEHAGRIRQPTAAEDRRLRCEPYHRDASRTWLLRRSAVVRLNLPIRLRLTLLYCLVLGLSFVAFFYICDIAFQHSIETTVNEASRGNLEIIRRLLQNASQSGKPQLQRELSDLAALWANGA